MNRLQPTLRSLGGARETVSTDDIEAILRGESKILPVRDRLESDSFVCMILEQGGKMRKIKGFCVFSSALWASLALAAGKPPLSSGGCKIDCSVSAFSLNPLRSVVSRKRLIDVGKDKLHEACIADYDAFVAELEDPASPIHIDKFRTQICAAKTPPSDDGVKVFTSYTGAIIGNNILGCPSALAVSPEEFTEMDCEEKEPEDAPPSPLPGEEKSSPREAFGAKLLKGKISFSIPRRTSSLFGIALTPGIAFFASKVSGNEPFAEPMACESDGEKATDLSYGYPSETSGDALLMKEAAPLHTAIEGGIYLILDGRFMGQPGQIAQVQGWVSTVADLTLLPDPSRINDIIRTNAMRYEHARDLSALDSPIDKWGRAREEIRTAARDFRGAVVEDSEALLKEFKKLPNVREFFKNLKSNMGDVKPALRLFVLGKMLYVLDRDGGTSFIDKVKGEVKPEFLYSGGADDFSNRPSFTGKIRNSVLEGGFQKTLMAGPIPILLKAGMRGGHEVSGDFVTRFELPSTRDAVRGIEDATVGFINSTEVGVQGQLLVGMNAYASAAVGFAIGDLAEISAGIEADVTLVNGHFAPRLTLRPGTTALANFNLMTGLYAPGAINLFRARVDLYARARLLFVAKEWRFSLINFQGFSVPLGSGAGPVKQWKLNVWTRRP